MYSNKNRSEEYISKLLTFINKEYGFKAAGITPAKRGFYGETWRLDTEGVVYFLKLVYATKLKDIYEQSFPVVQHLGDHGIDFISKIVKTVRGDLFTRFDGAALGVFDWIDGELIETDTTKIPEYQMLAKVYTVPTDGISIPREDFSCKCADKVFKQWSALDDGHVRALLEKNRSTIEHRAARLKLFSKICSGDTAGFVITHGDAGGNFIMNGDRCFIVDWDYALHAPPERDAWVMCSREWARDAFHEALRQNGITHTLRREWLAYYCYHYFFFYLMAFLDASAQAENIEDYINGWIVDSFKFADEVT